LKNQKRKLRSKNVLLLTNNAQTMPPRTCFQGVGVADHFHRGLPIQAVRAGVSTRPVLFTRHHNHLLDKHTDALVYFGFCAWWRKKFEIYFWRERVEKQKTSRQKNRERAKNTSKRY
jgi:hypothetical protein